MPNIVLRASSGSAPSTPNWAVRVVVGEVDSPSLPSSRRSAATPRVWGRWRAFHFRSKSMQMEVVLVMLVVCTVLMHYLNYWMMNSSSLLQDADTVRDLEVPSGTDSIDAAHSPISDVDRDDVPAVSIGYYGDGTEDEALRADEQRDPPVKAYYWWNKYRSAIGSDNSNEAYASADDAVVAVDDGSCGPGGGRSFCAPHGFCSHGKCVCVIAYSGPSCSMPAPALTRLGFASSFNGSFVLNQERVQEDNGIRFKTDTSANPPPTHPYVRIPVSKEVWASLPGSDILGEANIYDTCAIVGSSGSLRGYPQGEAIDAHDMVLRLNRAPTAKWERYVGTRTSYRFVTSANIGWHDGRECVLLPMSGRGSLYLHCVFKRKHPAVKAYLTDTQFHHYVASTIPEDETPTIGYIATLLVLHKCAHVTVYGFHPVTNTGLPVHYYDEAGASKKGGKKSLEYDLEYSLMLKLVLAGVIAFGEPCALGCEKETGRKCTSCAPGSTCPCSGNSIIPVALAGYCRQDHRYDCFYACPGGPAQCRGGVSSTRCPKSVARMASKGSLHCVSQDEVDRREARANQHPPEPVVMRGWGGGSQEKAVLPDDGAKQGQSEDTRDMTVDPSLVLDSGSQPAAAGTPNHTHLELPVTEPPSSGATDHQGGQHVDGETHDATDGAELLHHVSNAIEEEIVSVRVGEQMQVGMYAEETSAGSGMQSVEASAGGSVEESDMGSVEASVGGEEEGDVGSVEVEESIDAVVEEHPAAEPLHAALPKTTQTM